MCTKVELENFSLLLFHNKIQGLQVKITKNFKKFIIICVIWLAIFLPTTLIKINIPCIQCGKPSFSENIWCRIATGFNTSYMHDYCAEDYCKDNPVDWGFVVDEDGKKYTLDHYKKLFFRE
tara:strand:- start:547 stop:909 length:363 start_codon:yes stop_codon:yes gene_type:complete